MLTLHRGPTHRQENVQRDHTSVGVARFAQLGGKFGRFLSCSGSASFSPSSTFIWPPRTSYSKFPGKKAESAQHGPTPVARACAVKSVPFKSTARVVITPLPNGLWRLRRSNGTRSADTPLPTRTFRRTLRLCIYYRYIH